MAPRKKAVMSTQEEVEQMTEDEFQRLQRAIDVRAGEFITAFVLVVQT